MNWYPTIIHPITKEHINLFSKEINDLLQEFTEQYLINRDRVQYQSIFTGIQDIDHEMMLYLNVNQLKQLCSVNHYAHQLCNKSFWMKKIKHDGLMIPSVHLSGNWFEIYSVLNIITESSDSRCHYIHKIHDLQLLLNKYHIDFSINNDDDIEFVYRSDIQMYGLWYDDYIQVNKQVFIDFLFEGFMNDMIRIEKD